MKSVVVESGSGGPVGESPTSADAPTPCNDQNTLEALSSVTERTMASGSGAGDADEIKILETKVVILGNTGARACGRRINFCLRMHLILC